MVVGVVAGIPCPGAGVVHVHVETLFAEPAAAWRPAELRHHGIQHAALQRVPDVRPLAPGAANSIVSGQIDFASYGSLPIDRGKCKRPLVLGGQYPFQVGWLAEFHSLKPGIDIAQQAG